MHVVPNIDLLMFQGGIIPVAVYPLQLTEAVTRVMDAQYAGTGGVRVHCGQRGSRNVARDARLGEKSLRLTADTPKM